MNQEQIRLLSKMRKLIYDKKRRFEPRLDRDYVEDLLDFGLTEEEAWDKHIIYLNSNFYYIDTKPNYSKKDNLSLTFKKPIDGKVAYIKLRIELNELEEETVCLSFHLDGKPKKGVVEYEV